MGRSAISGSGVVNAKSGLHIATSGGTANVSIKTGGELIVANGLAVGGGGTSAATLTLNNATLQIASGTTAFATFGLGSTFNFQSGTMQLAGNATFNSGSVFNWSGGTINATGKTLGVSTGAATFTWGGIAVNNNTISVTNGGSLNVSSVAGTGPAGFAGTITLNGGTLNTIGTATFVSGTTVNASNISGLNLGDNSTFASGSTINLGGIFFTLPSGKTLTVDGGAVTDTRNLLLDSNETLQIQNGGHWDAVQEDLGGGTLLVTGSGSRFTSSSGTFASEWGGPGLNVTFTNGGIGTFAGRVDFGGGTFTNQMSVTAAVATFGGLTSGANTTVNGVTGATTFSIGFGAQLAVTGTAQFNNGAVVNNSGILRLGGNTTFSTGSTCNLSGIGGQLVMGSGTTLTFNGGVGSFATSPLDVDLASGVTLRVTNAGMIMSTTEVGIANGAATGTLLVDSGSTFSVNSTLLPCFWGTNTGNVATVTFSSNSVGTFLPGVLMSTSGGNSIVNILSGAKLTTGSLTMGSTGATASLTINGGSLNVTGSATLNNGGQIFLQAGSLTVGGTLTVNAGGGINDTFQLLRTGGLSMSGTGTIDLQSASMIVSNTALSTIKGYVSSGYAGGLWIGSGILSLPAFVNPNHNTALGYASAGSIGLNDIRRPVGQSHRHADPLHLLRRYQSRRQGQRTRLQRTRHELRQDARQRHLVTRRLQLRRQRQHAGLHDAGRQLQPTSVVRAGPGSACARAGDPRVAYRPRNAPTAPRPPCSSIGLLRKGNGMRKSKRLKFAGLMTVGLASPAMGGMNVYLDFGPNFQSEVDSLNAQCGQANYTDSQISTMESTIQQQLTTLYSGYQITFSLTNSPAPGWLTSARPIPPAPCTVRPRRHRSGTSTPVRPIPAPSFRKTSFARYRSRPSSRILPSISRTTRAF